MPTAHSPRRAAKPARIVPPAEIVADIAKLTATIQQFAALQQYFVLLRIEAMRQLVANEDAMGMTQSQREPLNAQVRAMLGVAA